MAWMNLTVVSGRGWGQTRLTAHTREIERLLGTLPAPGTLNGLAAEPVRLDPAKGRMAHGGKRMFWPSQTSGGRSVLIHRWRDCPLHVFEIIASVHLRTALDLSDGSAFPLLIPQALRAPLRSTELAAWTALWSGKRAEAPYTSTPITRLLMEGAGGLLGATQRLPRRRSG